MPEIGPTFQFES